MKTIIHASSGIRTHDPSNQAAKTYALDSSATDTGCIVVLATEKASLNKRVVVIHLWTFVYNKACEQQFLYWPSHFLLVAACLSYRTIEGRTPLRHLSLNPSHPLPIMLDNSSQGLNYNPEQVSYTVM
jgi:hypothetical protein